MIIPEYIKYQKKEENSMAVLNVQDVPVSENYKALIRSLHDEKIKINQAKIKHYGSIDIDDHGFVDFPDFKFEPILCDDGLVHGNKVIGENFKKFLHEMPRYIYPDSALAGCWIGNLSKYVPFAPAAEDHDPEADAVFQKYQIIQSGFTAMNHLCPDVTIGLDLGWQGLLDKVRHYRALNCKDDTDFYDGEELLLEGTLDWINGLVDLAEERAASEEDLFHKANYQRMAEMNRALCTRKPETFVEACQFIAHFQSIDRMYFVGGALGNLDAILRPYYEQDMADGILTDDEAVWILASLLYNDTHYSQLGGLTPNGQKDTVDHLSFVILEAMHLLKIPANIAIRVHPWMGEGDLSKDLIHKSLEYTLQDGTGVNYSLEHGIADGFAKNGYPTSLGRMRVKCGCNWCAIPGLEYPLQDVTRISMPMAMQFAMEDLEKDSDPNLDKLWDLFIGHLTTMVDAVKRGYDRNYEVQQHALPEIVLNLFMHGPIERGLNCANGGVDIMEFNIDGIGLATVADSFTAIEQRVVEEKKITWDRLFTLLDTNYEGAEKERLMMKNIARFGNPNSNAEKWALKIRDAYVDICRKTDTPKHHFKIIPGMFSHGDIVMYGKQLKASANGRKAGEPISHSTEPDPGFAKGYESFSYVLKAEAVAITQPGYGNSAPLQLDIDNTLLQKTGGIDALMALIYTHEKEGGTLINLNCLSKEQLLEAHKDPSKYPELVVRVTGYSAFFASLSKEYRQQVVDRFLAGA